MNKRAAEVRNLTVDLSHKLATDEVLTGTPTVVEVSTTDLTISDIALNLAVYGFGGSVSIADRAVTFTVAGGTAGHEYTIRITAETDDGQTLISDVTLRVN